MIRKITRVFLSFLLASIIFSSCACETEPDLEEEILPPWIETFGKEDIDESRSVVINKDGSILLAGNHYRSQTIQIFETKIPTDVFLLKYDKTGKKLWEKSFPAKDSEVITSLATDQDGNIYLTGYFGEEFKADTLSIKAVGFNDIFVMKLSKDGKPIWLKGFGSSGNDEAKFLSVTDKGEVSVVGLFSKEVEVGNTKLVSSGSKDPFLIRFDTNGNVLWATSFGTTTIEEDVVSCKTDKQGNTYVLGYFTDPLSIDSTNLKTNGYEDVFVLKFDPKGKLVWGRSYGSNKTDKPGQLYLDGQGGVFFSLRFIGKITLGNKTITSDGVEDILIVKLDSTGKTTWSQNISFQSKNTYELLLSTIYKGQLYLATNFSNEIKVGGKKQKATDVGEILVFNFLDNGDMGWVKAVGKAGLLSDAKPKTLGIGPNDKIILSGTFSGTMKFLDSVKKAKGKDDVFVLQTYPITKEEE